jgi:putative transcriptional regulator
MTCPIPPSQSPPPRPTVAMQLKAVRRKLGLSQSEFARTFALTIGAVRDWEQGRFYPDRAARVLLQVIAHNPDAVKAALRARDAAMRSPADGG